MFDAAYINDALNVADFNQAQKLIRLLTFVTNAGDPTSSLTPDFQGQYCRDVTNQAIYWASTAISSGWKKLTP